MLTTAVAIAITAGMTPLGAAQFEPAAQADWTAYVAAVEGRIARELASNAPFLALDRDAQGAAERASLLRGDVVTRRLSAADASGNELKVTSATIQHWRGAVFVPGTTLAAVIHGLQSGAPTWQDDVLDGAVLVNDGNHMVVFLKLQRRKLVTVVYDTEHDVTFHPLGPTREASTSRSTKIAELDDAGTAGERELGPGQDHGFLWRLNAYWRYEQVTGGVIAECESISLSRQAPRFLGTLLAPLIEGTARESMEKTLSAFRSHFTVTRMPRAQSQAR